MCGVLARVLTEGRIPPKNKRILGCTPTITRIAIGYPIVYCWINYLLLLSLLKCFSLNSLYIVVNLAISLFRCLR